MPPLGYRCVKGWCTDKYVEDVVFPHIKCQVRPNTWTMINLLVVVPLVLFFLYRKPSLSVWVGFVVLVCLNRTLDIVDGTVARQCNMKSKTGAMLDIFTDTILAIGVFAVVLAVAYRSRFKSPALLSVVLVVLGVNVISHVVQLANELSRVKGREISKIESLIADNSLYIFVALMVCVKLILDYRLR